MSRDRIAEKSFKDFLFSVWSPGMVREILCLWAAVGIGAFFPVIGWRSMIYRAMVTLPRTPVQLL